MNSILWRRFMLYCAAALTAFSLVMGILYEWRLRVYTQEAAAAELIARAEAVAALVAGDVLDPLESQRTAEPPENGRRSRGCGMMSGKDMHRHKRDRTPQENSSVHGHQGAAHTYCRQTVNEAEASGLYLRHLEALAEGTVWLVDRDSRTITLYGAEESASFDALPPEAETLLAQIFSGQFAASQAFDPLLSAPSVTAGAPLKDAAGNITGAVLQIGRAHV